MKIKTLTQTCLACPSQWEGKTKGGKDIYIRYRHGSFRVEIDGEIVLHQSVGDGLDGLMSTDEMLKLVRPVLKPCKSLSVGSEDPWVS